MTNYPSLVEKLEVLHKGIQKQAIQSVNTCLLLRNWLFGCHIVEYEQNGEDRAKYGEKLMSHLSQDLTQRLGKGFTDRNLRFFRSFYLTYPMLKSVISRSASFSTFINNFRQLKTPEIRKSVISKSTPTTTSELLERLIQSVSWTHFIELVRIADPMTRSFYEIETLKNRWSVRELKRQINSMLYERVGLSKDKDGVLELAKGGGQLVTPEEMIHDPYIFEFLGLPEHGKYSETELESALIDHLEDFLLELGKGFCFVGRQKRITVDNEHYFVDLVLYNRKLKCLVLIDVKVDKFRPDFAGQMNFYINAFKTEEMEEGENPPIGIVLCTERSRTHVEYALGGISNQIFVSKYMTVLPSKEEFSVFIDRERRNIEDGT